MNELLLPTKLYYPQLRPSFIARPQLIEKLNHGLAGKLTLISAPAGFGKTTLLSEWVRTYTKDELQGDGDTKIRTAARSPQHFAWLSLDGYDNELTRFLSYFIAAWQTAVASTGQRALARLHSSQPVSTETLLTLLINDLSQLEDKVVLILDDYHLISNPAVHTALLFLLEHLPLSAHLVLASRSDPPLALARWRVRGELHEIRATDLRFTAAETTRFLQQTLGHPLAAVTTELLNQRTEGWAAGLHLAALSLRGLDATATAQFVADFGGTNRHIAAYLVEEVWQRQPAFVQQFLLHTALLKSLTAPLCEAVTVLDFAEIDPEAASTTGIFHTLNAQTILEYLVTNNLFLQPLDTDGRWFRYHTFFAEALQERLHETQPELILELHQRAGRWYAANGYTEQAIQHALAAQDIDTAAHLTRTAARALWTQGKLVVLLSWLDALPETTLQTDLELCLLYAWLLFLNDRWSEARQRLQLAEPQFAALSPDELETRRQRGRYAAIHGAMAALRQDSHGAISWMEAALADLPADDVHWQQVAVIGLGLAQLAEGQAQMAIDTLHQAAVTCEQHHDLYLAFAAWWHLSEAYGAQGHLHAVSACLHRLELLAERDEGDWLALRANAAIGRGMLAYERNELATAVQELTTALPHVWPGGQPRVALQAYLTLARIAYVQGDSTLGQEHLNTAAHLVHEFNLTAERLLLAATTARLLLSEGQLLEAHWQLEELGLGPQSTAIYRHEMGLLTLVRLYLAERRTAEAWAILARLLAAAEAAERTGSLVEIYLLQALALAQQQQQDRAVAYLQRALTLAEPEQFGRLFLNEGRPLMPLLQQLAPSMPYAAHLLEQWSKAPLAEPELDPLTDRELEILTLVASGASNQRIANQLVISLGTVKGHLNHILSKLDVHNRTEAVARGRQLGLLTGDGG